MGEHPGDPRRGNGITDVAVSQVPDATGDQLVSPADLELVDRLRAGDEGAFARLVDQSQGAMLRVAGNYVATRAEAEEVVQETWLAVIQGLDRFEGRSTLKTWIFRILMNTAISHGRRERRSVPFSAAFDPATEPSEPAVAPGRFRPESDRHPGGWVAFPGSWAHLPEDRLLSGETMGIVEDALRHMPAAQREVLIMRDVQGMNHIEACNVLGVSATNQRVLLHRARGRVRRALEQYLDPRDVPGGGRGGEGRP
jgi:RNA polymerase sigma-70 factor (ECF subfamily)